MMLVLKGEKYMKKIIDNKWLSLSLITIIYIVAILGSIFAFNAFDRMDFWLRLLVADVIGTVIIFIFSLLLRNASVYDPYWSVQPIVIILAFVFKVKINVPIILMLLVILLWGIRLTINWVYTFYNLNYKDWRYKMLKEKTKSFYLLINFIGIHMVPTLIVYLATIPACYLLFNPSKITIFTILGTIVSLLAIILELISDIQMHKYRKHRTTLFIREGLWKYSRHPNYLGEILMWWGVAIIATGSLIGNYHYLFLGAFLNTLLFLFVSLPMAEGRQAKKEGFIEYKKETRLLLPVKRIKKS